MIQLIKKSGSGSTTQITTIFEEIPNVKSSASLLLLTNQLALLDEDYLSSMEFINKRIQFSRNYLENELKEKGDLVCTYCHTPGLIIEYDFNFGKIKPNKMATIDHINPISNGGEIFNINNVCCACSKCNTNKRSKPVEQFLNEINN